MNENTAPSSTSFNPMHLIEALLSRFKLILGITILFTLIGLTYLSFQTPLYTSTALLQLNVKELPVMDAQSLIIGQIDDQAAVQSELDILRSPELAARVITRLSLYDKEEFNPKKVSQTKVSKLKRGIKNLLKRDDSETSPFNEEVVRVRVLRAVQSRVAFYKDPLSYTVRIDFTSEIPERAKHIANAFAYEYMRYQVETHEARSRQANAWLANRVDELRRQVIESENAVQRFSEVHNLFELDGMTLDNQQLAELNTQLAEARSQIAQSEARLSQAKILLSSGSGAESLPEVLNSNLIQSLREQEAILMREQSELSQHFGPKHPTMEKINSELNDLRRKIDLETRKIVQGLENELNVADQRAQGLQSEIEMLRSKLGISTKQSVQLEELKREADVNRSMYEAFLTRLKETGEAITLQQSNAKIIAQAQLPLNPSAPNKPLIMALFLMSGMFLGVTLALLLEYFSRGFSSPEQIEAVLGIESIGMVPEIHDYRGHLANFTVEYSSAMETEALRRILANLQFSARDNAPKSVLIMSSLPQEGKGWIATSLARVSAQSGKRVLLLDCDLHRHSVAESFGIKPKHVLNDYFNGDAELSDIIATDDKTGLDYIGSEPMKTNIQKTLESDRMKHVMDYAHAHYDLIFVDAPPVIGLSDVLFLSRLVDSTVFVIRHNNTPRRMAHNALRSLSRAKINLTGAVLSRMDPADYKKHEFGGKQTYQTYGDYYQDAAPQEKGKILKFKTRN